MFEESMTKIDTSSWKEFKLADIADLSYGSKFDKNKMTYNKPTINFVSRTANNNGISDIVDIVDGVEPFQAGCLTLALGGSIGSCFLQEQPFYTGQNVGVIKFSNSVDRHAKLFILTAIQRVCKCRFVTFSDEINKHFKTDLAIKLPVTSKGQPDYAYMSKFMLDLEAVQLADLEAYLRTLRRTCGP